MTIGTYGSMDDDALEASLYEGEQEAETDEATTQGGEETPAGEEEATDEEDQDESQAEDADEEGETPDPSEGETDDGPGDRKVALKQEREKARAEADARKAAEERAAKAEAELQRIRDAQAQELARQEDAQIQAHYDALMEDGKKDEARQFLQRVQEHHTETLNARHQSQLQYQAITLSEEMAREVFPDYDARIEHLGSVLGAEGLTAIVGRALKENPKAPAKWVYEYAKKNFATEADIEALAEEKAKAKLAAAQAKNQPPSTRGPRTIAHASSDTQNPGRSKPIRKMSDAELNRELMK